MKRFLCTILVLCVVSPVLADVTSTNRDNFIKFRNEGKAILDGQSSINNVLETIDDVVADLEAYIVIVQGSTDTDVLACGTSMYQIKQTLKNGAQSIRSNYPCYLNGECE